MSIVDKRKLKNCPKCTYMNDIYNTICVMCYADMEPGLNILSQSNKKSKIKHKKRKKNKKIKKKKKILKAANIEESKTDVIDINKFIKLESEGNGSESLVRVRYPNKISRKKDAKKSKDGNIYHNNRTRASIDISGMNW